MHFFVIVMAAISLMMPVSEYAKEERSRTDVPTTVIVEEDGEEDEENRRDEHYHTRHDKFPNHHYLDRQFTIYHAISAGYDEEEDFPHATPQQIVTITANDVHSVWNKNPHGKRPRMIKA